MRDRGVGSGKWLRFGAKILNCWGAVTGETTCKKTLKRSLAPDFRAGAGSPEARRRAAIPGLDAPPAAAPPGRGGSRGVQGARPVRGNGIASAGDLGGIHAGTRAWETYLSGHGSVARYSDAAPNLRRWLKAR